MGCHGHAPGHGHRHLTYHMATWLLPRREGWRTFCKEGLYEAALMPKGSESQSIARARARRLMFEFPSQSCGLVRDFQHRPRRPNLCDGERRSSKPDRLLSGDTPLLTTYGGTAIGTPPEWNPPESCPQKHASFRAARMRGVHERAK